MEFNPAAEERPVISEKTASLALPLRVQLQEGLPGGYQVNARRNRLVLLLMMRCALTVTEIITLRLGSVQVHEGSPDQVADRRQRHGPRHYTEGPVQHLPGAHEPVPQGH
jgi:hypothetical protein